MKKTYYEEYGKKYYEKYAGLTLDIIFPKFKNNWCYLDKPDLQNEINDIGIEVTMAKSQTIGKIEAYGYEHLGNKVSQKEIDNFRGEFFIDKKTSKVYAFSPTKGLVTHKHIENIQGALQKKKLKFASNEYKKYKQNGLYIFLVCVLNKNEINSLKNIAHAPFDFVILNCIDGIHYWSNQTVDSYKVSNEQLTEYKKKALEYERQVQQG